MNPNLIAKIVSETIDSDNKKVHKVTFKEGSLLDDEVIIGTIIVIVRTYLEKLPVNQREQTEAFIAGMIAMEFETNVYDKPI